MDTENQKKIWVAAFCAAMAGPNASVSYAETMAAAAVQKYVERFSSNYAKPNFGLAPDQIQAQANLNAAAMQARAMQDSQLDLYAGYRAAYNARK